MKPSTVKTLARWAEHLFTPIMLMFAALNSGETRWYVLTLWGVALIEDAIKKSKATVNIYNKIGQDVRMQDLASHRDN